MSDRPRLAELAQRAQIAASYMPAGGGGPRWIEDETRVALLAALGLDGCSEAAAQRALALLDERERERVLPATVLLQAGEAAALEVRGSEKLEAELWLEGGERCGVRIRMGEDGRARAQLPDLAAGYHALVLQRGGLELGRAALLAAPARCRGVTERLGGRSGVGVWANLYALRREAGGVGIGDFGALRELIAWVGAAGADFVGLSPLHALAVRGGEVSPYSPQSRWFRSPLYLELAAVPEFADSDAAQLLAQSAELAELHAARWLDHERIERLQERVLERLHRAFVARHETGDTERGAQYARYLAEQGERLREFAVFRALARWLAQRGFWADWRGWPAEYRSPDGAAVAQFAQAHADTVAREQWLQFELDRQLAELARAGQQAGMGLGLYSDLALGSAPGSFDTWRDPELFAAGVSVGAPADPLGPLGQDWGFPPLAPAVLAARGFADWAQLVRANLRHAGALRIDHILGCMRQWWIPSGFAAARGAYVCYPLAELLAVLAIESQRSGALIIGEDLGTVPEGLETELEARGVLSLKVLLFEREWGGGFRAARDYSPRALACATTHDVPTLAALWCGNDLQLRRELELLDEAGWGEALAERVQLRAALLARLREEGLLPWQGEPELGELVRAVHAFLSRTPAPLVALALGDLSGELEPVNVPGVPPQRYRSWTRRMERSVEELGRSPARAELAELAAGRTGAAKR